MIRPLFLISLSILLSACVSTPGPVEVTRFVASDATARLGKDPIFVTAGEGSENALSDAPYRAAVAKELGALGYSETSRSEASQIAEVRVEHYVLDDGERRRGPVSVGVGGSTGSYGSGVGLGIGINLGGGDSGPMLGTELSVAIRDKSSDTTLWEGRADFRINEKSPLAQPAANAQTLANALFREFPGNNGETVSVEVIE